MFLSGFIYFHPTTFPVEKSLWPARYNSIFSTYLILSEVVDDDGQAS